MDRGRHGKTAECQEVIVTRTETTKTNNAHSRVLGTGRDQTSLICLIKWVHCCLVLLCNYSNPSPTSTTQPRSPRTISSACLWGLWPHLTSPYLLALFQIPRANLNPDLTLWPCESAKYLHFLLRQNKDKHFELRLLLFILAWFGFWSGVSFCSGWRWSL